MEDEPSEQPSTSFVEGGSKRGGTVVFRNNFRFNFHKNLSGNEKRWKCVGGARFGCKAYLRTVGKKVIEAHDDHNHEGYANMRNYSQGKKRRGAKRKADAETSVKEEKIQILDTEYTDLSSLCTVSVKEEKIQNLDTEYTTDLSSLYTVSVKEEKIQNLDTEYTTDLSSLCTVSISPTASPSKSPPRPKGHQRVPSGSREFHEVTTRDAEERLQKEIEKLIDDAPEADRDVCKKEMDGFAALFRRYLTEKKLGQSIQWEKIQKLPEGTVRDYQSLTTPSLEEAKRMLEKLVVIKLNGGLGTSMGCHGPKSVIPVRSDLSFLDLTVQQIQYLNKKYGTNVPLVLMNSFNTDEDTQKIIKKYSGFQVEIYTFCQSCYPRVYKDTLLPVPKRCDPSIEPEGWYPPGHGDFYASLENSGLLDKFIAAGREYCFLSNIDNLGATVDLSILDMLMKENVKNNNEEGKTVEFVMEVTDKTKADVKGGTLIFYEDKLRLLEIAQVPKDHVDDFKSIKSFKFFNTNNLWIKLSAVKRVIQKAALNMEIIVNPKQLSNNAQVIQLETAVGAAMKSFNGALGINVPRSRFLPVKKTSDLMLVMSNLYDMCHGSLTMSNMRMFQTTPLVKLGDNHFSKVSEFLSRFPSIPDMLELDHLTVSGDVTFGKGVVLKGTVIIIANHGDRIDIPTGAVLENKIVSGNLRILDH